MKLPLVSGLFCSVLAVSLAAHPFTKDGWERVYPSAKEYGFTAMASDGERILATGTDGNLYSSETGDIWIKVGDRVFQNVNRIVGGGNDRWVLLGDAGRIAVGSPQNGWDLRQINLSNWVDAAWSGETMVAINEQSAMVRWHPDQGWSWTFGPWATSVAAGNGVFMAVGRFSVWRSEDGVDWEHLFELPEQRFYPQQQIRFESGRFYGAFSGEDRSPAHAGESMVSGSVWSNASLLSTMDGSAWFLEGHRFEYKSATNIPADPLESLLKVSTRWESERSWEVPAMAFTPLNYLSHHDVDIRFSPGGLTEIRGKRWLDTAAFISGESQWDLNDLTLPDEGWRSVRGYDWVSVESLMPSGRRLLISADDLRIWSEDQGMVTIDTGFEKWSNLVWNGNGYSAIALEVGSVGAFLVQSENGEKWETVSFMSAQGSDSIWHRRLVYDDGRYYWYGEAGFYPNLGLMRTAYRSWQEGEPSWTDRTSSAGIPSHVVSELRSQEKFLNGWSFHLFSGQVWQDGDRSRADPFEVPGKLKDLVIMDGWYYAATSTGLWRHLAERGPLDSTIVTEDGWRHSSWLGYFRILDWPVIETPWLGECVIDDWGQEKDRLFRETVWGDLYVVAEWYPWVYSWKTNSWLRIDTESWPPRAWDSAAGQWLGL